MFQVILAIILSSPIIASNNTTNYIFNGGFELPHIDPSSASYHNCEGWSGIYDLKGPLFTSFNLGFNQFLDLQNSQYVNGFIEQTLSLPYDGIYQLSYLQFAPNDFFESFVLEIYWNEELIAIKTANSLEVTEQNLTINTTSGNNTLSIVEVGNDSDFLGMHIDEVSLYLIEVYHNLTNCTQQNCTDNATFIIEQQDQKIQESDQEQDLEKGILNVLSTILSLPLSQIPSFKYLLFLVEDLWLYYHNPRSYSGIVDDIFQTIVTIEKLKFKILSNWVDVEKIVSLLPFSNYSAWTEPKFQEIQTSDSVLFKVIFNFFLYTIPSNILICFIFYQVFKAISSYKISALFRRYYFFGGALLQVLFQGNISYFTFCCFNHLGHAFSFNFFDKISLLINVMVLFIVLMVSICFYLFIGKVYQKQSCYFIYCFYRCQQTFFYLVIHNMVIQFLKGCLHYFLLNHYDYLIGSLCLLEFVAILYTVYMQSIHQIFIPKLMFICYLCYHFIFILFNLSLYWEQVYKQKGVDTSPVLEIQKIVIICLIVVNGLMMIIDLIPYEYLKFKQLSIEQQLDEPILAIEIYNQNGVKQQDQTTNIEKAQCLNDAKGGKRLKYIKDAEIPNDRKDTKPKIYKG